MVVTQGGGVLLQERGAACPVNPGGLNLFGGHVEAGESPLEALVRELREELGAVVAPGEVVPIGAVTEAWTGHTQVVHVHFWRDVRGTITGCYEHAAREISTARAALAAPRLMPYAAWALRACASRGLLAG